MIVNVKAGDTVIMNMFEKKVKFDFYGPKSNPYNNEETSNTIKIVINAVILLHDDNERIENKRRYGVGIYPYDGSFNIDDEDAFTDYLASVDVLERVYAPSEESALHNAKLVCEEKNYTIFPLSNKKENDK